jgi:xanthine dehydrogenase molybdenum-binding subunit
VAKIIGRDFIPSDIHSKVTGRAKYAEDIRMDGMLFCRLLKSPIPHARVKSLDYSEALSMEGVVSVLTADEVFQTPGPSDNILTNEPHFVGEPILAVAAVSEKIAQDAIDRIKIELVPLPFCLDPLESLRPEGPNARVDGNTIVRGEGVKEIKWKEEDFLEVAGELPMGEPGVEWSYGELERGFEDASLILDESFVTASNAHHSMEPRSAMAFWQNGKCHIYGSTQSQAIVVPGLARYIGIEPEDLVYISQYCGGGFGSKGGAYPLMAIPALLSKKTSRPVLMRISRAEEYFLGSARIGFQGRIKLGFRDDGRITAVDLYIVQENGPNTGFGDMGSAADAVSLVYTPMAMRYRGISILTNTPPRGAQRGPGQNQIAAAVEPLIDKAAKRLGIDGVKIRRLNAPDSRSLYGGSRNPVTSAHLREALDKGAKKFGWNEKKSESGSRKGSKVIGVGVGQAFHSAGSSGFDGLVRISTDGKLHIHTGVGNLGTYSYAATSRVAAEILGYRWENCEIVRGDSSKHLPWNNGQFGSNTSFTMTRTNYVAAMDALQKLKELASISLGGSWEDYDIENETVVNKGDSNLSMSYADLAVKAIEIGGRYSGKELASDDLNEMTIRAVEGLAGTGLIGVARDNLDRTGTVPALAAGFIKIELDIETGAIRILDYLGVADCGTVLHPQGLAAQVKSGAIMGFGMACTERHFYDSQWGIPGGVGFYQAKPPSYLDVPLELGWDAVDIPDPQNPVGAKGIGEPLMGCATSALLCAISDALGGHYFNRTPVVPDMIVNAAAGQEQSHSPLQVNTQ